MVGRIINSDLNSELNFPNPKSKNIFSNEVFVFLNKVQKFARCSDSTYVVAFIYLEKVYGKILPVISSIRDAYQLILALFIIAMKYNDDRYVDNEDFADVGGISLNELNLKEIYILTILEFSVHIMTDEYERYNKKLTKESEGIQSYESDNDKIKSFEELKKSDHINNNL